MENLSKAEKHVIRDFRVFLIRNHLELVTWEKDELGFVYLTNNNKDGGEEEIFLRIEELVKEIGVTVI